LQKQKHNAFSLIELLVVIAIIGIFSAFALPNVASWLTKREVKKEVYSFVSEINEMRSKVTSGEYALAMIKFRNGGTYASIEKKYMTRSDFSNNYSGSNKYKYTCETNQQYHKTSDNIFESQLIRHWPNNAHLCISKDGTKKGPLNKKNPASGARNTLALVIFCSVTNTNQNQCNASGKNDYRYMVTWDNYANLKIYNYNLKKNKWCSGKTCLSYGDFN
jgi:prepilin-type N-terminal cleavage/methylation domain-containing protein